MFGRRRPPQRPDPRRSHPQDIPAWQEWIKANPTDLEAMECLARLLLDEGRFVEAIDQLKRIRLQVKQWIHQLELIAQVRWVKLTPCGYTCGMEFVGAGAINIAQIRRLCAFLETVRLVGAKVAR